MFIRISFGEKLRKQPAICQHINSRFAMKRGVNAVQAMSQDGDSGNIIGQSRTMRMNINAISKSAHHQHIGKKRGQIV